MRVELAVSSTGQNQGIVLGEQVTCLRQRCTLKIFNWLRTFDRPQKTCTGKLVDSARANCQQEKFDTGASVLFSSGTDQLQMWRQYDRPSKKDSTSFSLPQGKDLFAV